MASSPCSSAIERKKAEECHFTLAIPTADGSFTASFSPQGLAELDFPSAKSSRPQPETDAKAFSAPPHWIKTTRQALERILAGKAPDELPPLDLSVGTDFQRRVWKALCGIPLGHTVTYAQLARTIGRPQAVRAVGQACGANPIPVLIPCHRVVAANGGLGGFSGGLDWKRKLLAREAGPELPFSHHPAG